jgi:hypothetical protein
MCDVRIIKALKKQNLLSPLKSETSHFLPGVEDVFGKFGIRPCKLYIS